MGNIASEVQARMREDGIDPSQSFVPGEASDGTFGDAGSGNSGGAPATPPPAADTSAGTPNTDTQPGQEPGPIPYTRFKEVNDRYNQLREYEQLSEYGYTPDHLVRLASFEAGYLRDPVGTVKALVDDLDLPSEAKARIAESLGAEAPPSGDGGGNEDDAGTVSALSPEDRALLAEVRQFRDQQAQERESAQRNAQLDGVMNIWKSKDTEDGVRSPRDRSMLNYISIAASMGNHRTFDDLAQAARRLWLEDRDEILGGAVQRNGNGNPPPALSDSAALPAPPMKFGSLAETRKVIQAALERGELPPIPGG